jgi:carbamoyl-phosphate synthase large subunit
LRAAFGYNESAMSVEWLLDGKLPEQPVLKQGYAVRYTEDLVFYDRTHL